MNKPIPPSTVSLKESESFTSLEAKNIKTKRKEIIAGLIRATEAGEIQWKSSDSFYFGEIGSHRLAVGKELFFPTIRISSWGNESVIIPCSWKLQWIVAEHAEKTDDKIYNRTIEEIHEKICKS